jgi:hypothetical protein
MLTLSNRLPLVDWIIRRTYATLNRTDVRSLQGPDGLQVITRSKTGRRVSSPNNNAILFRSDDAVLIGNSRRHECPGEAV